MARVAAKKTTARKTAAKKTTARKSTAKKARRRLPRGGPARKAAEEDYGAQDRGEERLLLTQDRSQEDHRTQDRAKKTPARKTAAKTAPRRPSSQDRREEDHGTKTTAKQDDCKDHREAAPARKTAKRAPRASASPLQQPGEPRQPPRRPSVARRLSAVCCFSSPPPRSPAGVALFGTGFAGPAPVALAGRWRAHRGRGHAVATRPTGPTRPGAGRRNAALDNVYLLKPSQAHDRVGEATSGPVHPPTGPGAASTSRRLEHSERLCCVLCSRLRAPRRQLRLPGPSRPHPAADTPPTRRARRCRSREWLSESTRVTTAATTPTRHTSTVRCGTAG